MNTIKDKIIPATLYDLYDACVENAKNNNIEITTDYVKQYAENAYSNSVFITEEQAKLIVDKSKLEISSQDEFFHCIESVLINKVIKNEEI